MTRAEAYRSQSAFERYVPEAFKKRLGRSVLRARKAMATGDSETLRAIENSVNALRVPAKRIEVAPAVVLGRGRGRTSRSLKRDAERLILTGGYMPQLLFSGAASRLGIGAMYFLDVSGLARAALGRGGLTRPQRQAVRRTLAAMPDAGRKKLVRAVAREARKPRVGLGLGPRQLIGYRRSLEKLCRRAGAAVEPVLRRVPLLMHLPEGAAGEVLKDLRSRGFYGFDRRNVFFLIQPTGRGYAIRGGRIVRDRMSPRLPAGHGYPLMQLSQPGVAFRLGAGGRREYLKHGLIEELRSRRVRIVAAKRVNDLTHLTADSLDTDVLALTLSLMGRLEDPSDGFNMVVELVENPANQKGGFWKRDKATGRKALAETLNLKTPEFDAFMSRLRKPPYNAFRNLYKAAALERFFSRGGFTPFLRFRHGRMYPETVTGEATEFPSLRAEAFRRPGEVIHDFKELKNLPEALRFAGLQDRDPGFVRLAKAA